MNSSISQILRVGFRASLVSIVLLFTQVYYSSAQKGKFHVGATVGYGFSLASQNIPKGWSDLFIEIGSGPGSLSPSLYSTAQNGSYGAGIAIDIFGGYSITDHISTELGVEYLFGRSYVLDRPKVNWTQTSGSYRTGGNMLRLLPSVKYRFKKGRFSPFMQVGLVMGVMNRLNFKEEWAQTSQGVVYSQSTNVYRYTGGASWGASFSMGTEFKITKTLSASMALTAIGLSYSPLRGEMVKYEVNGEDRLSEFSVRSKEIRFVKTVGLGESSDDESVPRKQPKLAFPFSSFGLRTGIVYSFSFKRKK